MAARPRTNTESKGHGVIHGLVAPDLLERRSSSSKVKLAMSPELLLELKSLSQILLAQDYRRSLENHIGYVRQASIQPIQTGTHQ